MRAEATALPSWIKPQLTKLVDAPQEGPEWLHEIKFDGYRMHARLDQGAVRLLTRTGLDWTHKYPAIAAAFASFPARQTYLDGELCGVRSDGTTSFSLIQNASDRVMPKRSFFSVRPPSPRRRDHQGETAQGAKGAAARGAVACECALALRRSPDRGRAGLLRSRLRAEGRRRATGSAGNGSATIRPMRYD